ncbi:MAG TPA: DegT/DnrJ/EryC1/StrS family aminotransferase [Thermoanaerobaculia bacterium]|nr:DegT/DnrJ/EryC1/StrS family aminotransferase [Thermoanaerobaculia bacterium]
MRASLPWLGGRSRDRLAAELMGWSEATVRCGALDLVASARYGLVVAIRSLGLVGARIAVPAYVCPAVLTGLRAAGAGPLGIDIEEGSFRFAPGGLRRAVTEEGCAAVVAPATYGCNQDWELLGSLAAPVLDDAAYQAGLVDGGGRMCGARGAAGVWSFRFKALAGVGGGVLLSGRGSEPSHASTGRAPRVGSGELRQLGDYLLRSILRHWIPRALGGAWRPQAGQAEVRACHLAIEERPMSELQAAVALGQWQRREEIGRRQRRNTAMLLDALADAPAFRLAGEPVDGRFVHLLPLLVDPRAGDEGEALLAARRFLWERGIQTEDPYPVTLGEPEAFPSAHELTRRLLLVPCHPSLGEREIRHVAASLAACSEAILDRRGAGSSREVAAVGA